MISRASFWVLLPWTRTLSTSCHHAYFDEAWYLQPTCPPAAQLLYNCGLLAEEAAEDILPSPPTLMPHALYPPFPAYDMEFCTIPIGPAIQLPLPLSLHHTPSSITACAACLTPQLTSPHTGNKDSTAVSDFFITAHDMSQVYISQHPYKDGLEIYLDLRHKKHYSHHAAGMKFITVNGRLILQNIDKGTLAACIPRWWSELKGAWLREINSHPITTLDNIHWYLNECSTLPLKSCILTFSHPKIPHGLSNDGIPQVNIDQLNPCNLFSGFEIPPLPVAQQIG
jgi:hypothetical protein